MTRQTQDARIEICVCLGFAGDGCDVMNRGKFLAHSASFFQVFSHLDMTGILVRGDNHFIVRGPLPDRNSARALARHWSVIQIGSVTPAALDQWQIITREFRENLEWAVVVSDDTAISPAVTRLLDELAARGITIHSA